MALDAEKYESSSEPALCSLWGTVGSSTDSQPPQFEAIGTTYRRLGGATHAQSILRACTSFDGHIPGARSNICG